MTWKMQLGANFISKAAARFRVWAPHVSEMAVVFQKENRCIPMKRDEEDYFMAEASGPSSGDCYFYELDGKNKRPDPASRFQPEGIHGPSALVNPDDFPWTDTGWKGSPLPEFIFYEIHTGTFTSEGTFQAVIGKIPYLKDLGITCLEIMPVAPFPGKRNWGYDGVSLFAVQNSYGGPEGLKKLVNECHRQGLAVCLDVVYNHLGPEGNYLREFGPYFTRKYLTPWGEALNYDDPLSDPVRRFVIDNALFWVTEYHLDCLRLDAVHSIFDLSAKHLLEELNEKVQAQAVSLGRAVHVIAESDLHDPRIIQSPSWGGYGLAGQWSDDFHHSVHAFLTGERQDYYEDFGNLADIAKALKKGFVLDGPYSRFRKRKHGRRLKKWRPEQLVVYIQNHDQVGNRTFGERLSALVRPEDLKLAAALLLLSPNTPLLFMGEEYGEKAPFQYFIDHQDPALVEAVRRGRRQGIFEKGEIPDPKAEAAFLNSKLRWERLREKEHEELFRLYRGLIRLRNRITGKFPKVSFSESGKWLGLQYAATPDLGVLFSFAENEQAVRSPFGLNRLKPLLFTAGNAEGLRLWKAEFPGKIVLPARCAIAGDL